MKNSFWSFEEIQGAVDPKSLILPSNSHGIDNKEISWVKAVNAANDEECLLPSNAVYHPYYPKKINFFSNQIPMD